MPFGGPYVRTGLGETFDFISSAAGAAVLALVWLSPLRTAFLRPVVVPQNKPSERDVCKRCGKKIEVDPEGSTDMFEGMHWLCFHLEFEHDTDPDRACSDYGSCPWWTIRHYEERLRELGVTPEEVIQTAIHRHADEG